MEESIRKISRFSQNNLIPLRDVTPTTASLKVFGTGNFYKNV